MSICCKRKNSHLGFYPILQEIDLSPVQKRILEERYLSLINETNRRTFRISILYNVSHTIVTVGSIIVPALLSIQYTDTSSIVSSDARDTNYEIYWATWVISLLVTICNGLLTLFKIDKKYLYLHTNLEHLISEGWQYAELSGRYSGFHTPHSKPTHNNQFIFFCHTIEKIRMRQVEDEYNRLHETNHHTTDIKNNIIPPTPQNPQGNQRIAKQLLEEAALEKEEEGVDGSSSGSTDEQKPNRQVSVSINV